MRGAVYSVVAVALLALSSLGASCDDGTEEAEVTDVTGTPAGSGDESERITELPQVDISELTRGEKRIWADVVNDQLSPCGEPVSVARCAAEARGCRRCVPAARYVGRLVMEGYEKSEIEELYELRYGRDTEVEMDVAGAPVRGAPMAPVTIVEFSDFECPYCGATHPVLTRLLREYEGRIRLVFRHYPLDGHIHSRPAARAAVAAGNQGKFWEMHDLLFEHQEALEAEDLEDYAERLGLDMQRFRRDMESEQTQARIDADKERGHAIDVTGTPTILINGRRYQEPPRSLPAYIREELDE
jgi:protein-disulfide isomerase